jgi:hypothetical protein
MKMDFPTRWEGSAVGGLNGKKKVNEREGKDYPLVPGRMS